MRLFQDQIYQKGESYIRIVSLDRYQVEYKSTTGDPKGDAEPVVLAKKEFCRLLKGMTLMIPEKKEPVEARPPSTARPRTTSSNNSSGGRNRSRR